jgi:hypothetical protein
MPVDDFAHVPSADPDAEIDPHWLALRGTAVLPPTYMPPSMPGSHSRFTRVTAVVVTAVFLVATAAGVCLTYGPKLLGL